MAGFEVAQVRRAGDLIDFGEPEARPHLLEGWSFDEVWGSGGPSFVWSLGTRSALKFYNPLNQGLLLLFRCAPLRLEDTPPQVLAISANGSRIGEFSLHSGLTEYQLRIPHEYLNLGDNLLEFNYSSSARPIDMQSASKDPRELAVAWDWVRFEGIDSSLEPYVGESVEPVLILPYGSEVQYFTEIRPGSLLVIEKLQSWPPGREGGGQLLIEITTDSPERLIRRVKPSSDSPEFELPIVLDEQIVRIAFKALRNPEQGDAQVGLRLARPRLHLGENTLSESSRQVKVRLVKKPNVILYVIDTLRADHLGVYGYKRATSPHIDQFAREAVVFENAQAQSSWTRSSVASILTGLYPQTHQANGRTDGLAPRASTLPEAMTRFGYQSAGFITNGNIDSAFGFAQGFQIYRRLSERPVPEIHQLSDSLNEVVFEWLDQREKAAPFFLYLHSSDPHAPYLPREPYRSRLANGIDPLYGSLGNLARISKGDGEPVETAARKLQALYDAEIAFNDGSFGQFLAGLKQRGLYEQSLIIVLSDHGEEFFEHGGWQHGKTLYSEQLQIPFILKLPAGLAAGTRTGRLARQVDVFPTVADYLGLDVGRWHGKSLLPAVLQKALSPPHESSVAYLSLDGRSLESIQAGNYKIIRELNWEADPVLYNLKEDPLESSDLKSKRPVLMGYLSAVLRAHSLREDRLTPIQPTLEVDLENHLRVLGYLK